MRATEFLKGMLDMLSSIEDQEENNGGINIHGDVNIHGGHQAVEMPNHEEHDDSELDPNPVMIPPLQKKLEIMKKMAGLPNQAEKFTTIVADEDEPFEG